MHDLRDAIRRCDLTLDGRASPAFVRQCLAKLLMAFEPNTKLSGDETKLRISVWLEACGDLNDSLWADATAQAIQTMKWMPKPAEFRALVAPQLDRARKRKDRLRTMLDLLANPIAAPFVKEPLAVRLRGMRDGYRKIGKEAKAADLERALAKEENRQPEAWAMAAIPLEPQPADLTKPAAKLPEPSPEMKLALLKSRIEFFRDMGLLEYVERMEAELPAVEYEAAKARGEAA